MINILKKYFGYSKFKPGQEEIISSIISGKKVLAVLPTGAGKSLCYQIPAIYGESFSIVVSPLIALMKDQVDALNKNGIIAAFINSTLDYTTAEKVLLNIQKGKIKILYVSPERLSNNLFVEKLKELKPKYLFIDEAHCISQWGHNFRPSYLRIKHFADHANIDLISAFTATATPIVQTDIISHLGMKDAEVFISGFERDNLYLNVIHTNYKKEKTLKLIKENQQPILIYTATRKNAEELNDFLNLNGIDTNYYHAGLSAMQREIIQDDFLSGKLNIIIATNAFGMGIDKENIRTVIHYNSPGTIENYYQEIGRAGRDGQVSNIYLLYNMKDKILQEYFIKNNFPSKYDLEIVYNSICNYGEISVGTKSIGNIVLEKKFFNNLMKYGINELKFNSIANMLEDSGHIELKKSFSREYEFRFILNDKELKNYISSLRNNELKNFILKILQVYRGKAFLEQISLNLKFLSKEISFTKNEILANFSTLKNLGIITFKKPTNRPQVKLLQERVSFVELRINTNNIKKLFDNSVNKLEEMVAYSYTEKCRFNYILNYFGENKNNYACGHCDNCLKRHNSSLNFNEFIEDKILRTAHEAKFILRKSVLYKALLGNDKNGSLKTLSTYGSCAQYSKHEIDSSIDSIFSKGLIKIRDDSYYLSDKGKSYFIETPEAENIHRNKSENNSADETLELFNLLRESRKWLSKKYSQPVQYICSDDILRNIAKTAPSSTADLSSIKGINNRMLSKIGDEFLFEIEKFLKSKSNKAKRKYPPVNNLNDILSLINKNYKFEDIVRLTKLPESVIYLQIESLKSYNNDLDLSNLIDKKDMDLIEETAKGNIWENLKDLKNKLPHNMSYAKIKITLLNRKIEF